MAVMSELETPTFQVKGTALDVTIFQEFFQPIIQEVITLLELGHVGGVLSQLMEHSQEEVPIQECHLVGKSSLIQGGVLDYVTSDTVVMQQGMVMMAD